jgi:hypothetical protein
MLAATGLLFRGRALFAADTSIDIGDMAGGMRPHGGDNATER